MGCLVEDAPVVTAAADFPEMCIEWLPLEGPFGAGADWCDLTSHVAEITAGGGRQYEIGQFQASPASVTLKEGDRQLDVENPDGSFFPYLRTLKQVRWSNVWNGVRYPCWHGYITDFGDQTPDDVFYQQTIEAKDAFVIFDSIDLDLSWWELAVRADRPTYWWKLDEPDSALSVPIDSVGGAVGFYDGGRPTLGVTGIVPFDNGRTATTWNGAWINLSEWTPTSNGDFTVEGWCQLDSADLPATSQNYNLFFAAVQDVLDTTLFARFRLYVYGSASGTAGQLAANYTTNSGSNIARSGTRIDDGLPHQFVATLNSTGDTSIYLDGALMATATGGTTDPWFNVSTNGTTERGAIGTWLTGGGFPGTQSHLVVYANKILTATQVADHYAAGGTGWAGDTSGEAAARILDYMGWPAVWRDIDANCSATIGGYNLSGTLLSYLQSLADTELGAMFMDAENRLVFRSRYASYIDSRSTTSQATFGDGHSGEALTYFKEGFSLRRDEALIRNPVTASREGGISITVEDETLSDPETGYGPRDWSAPTTKHQLDSAIGSHARWLLAHFKDPDARLAAMQLKPRVSTAMWPAVLGLKNQDRITVKRTPLGQGTQIVSDQWVESLVHKASPSAFETAVVGAAAADADFLIVGVGHVGVGRVG